MAKLILTPVETAQHLVNAGFVGYQVIRMGSIAAAESGLNAYAMNVNDKPGSPDHRSVDVGLLQINDYWWLDPKGISYSQALDPATNALIAYDIFVARGGLRDPLKGYSAWNAYLSGASAKFHQQAVDAARAIGAW